MNMEQIYPLNINSLTYQPVIIQVFLNNEMFNFRMLKNYHEKKINKFYEECKNFPWIF